MHFLLAFSCSGTVCVCLLLFCHPKKTKNSGSKSVPLSFVPCIRVCSFVPLFARLIASYLIFIKMPQKYENRKSLSSQRTIAVCVSLQNLQLNHFLFVFLFHTVAVLLLVVWIQCSSFRVRKIGNECDSNETTTTEKKRNNPRRRHYRWRFGCVLAWNCCLNVYEFCL